MSCVLEPGGAFGGRAPQIVCTPQFLLCPENFFIKHKENKNLSPLNLYSPPNLKTWLRAWLELVFIGGRRAWPQSFYIGGPVVTCCLFAVSLGLLCPRNTWAAMGLLGQIVPSTKSLSPVQVTSLQGVIYTLAIIDLRESNHSRACVLVGAETGLSFKYVEFFEINA